MTHQSSDLVARLRRLAPDVTPADARLACAAAAEIERLRAALRSALAEIEDAGPKALKYAEQEIRKGLADG